MSTSESPTQPAPLVTATTLQAHIVKVVDGYTTNSMQASFYVGPIPGRVAIDAAVKELSEGRWNTELEMQLDFTTVGYYDGEGKWHAPAPGVSDMRRRVRAGIVDMLLLKGFHKVSPTEVWIG